MQILCCFFIAWHVATACLCFGQVHRLAIAIVRKMDCDELIDEMLSSFGETAEKQRYEGTAGDSLASPDAWRARSNWSEPATAGGA